MSKVNITPAGTAGYSWIEKEDPKYGKFKTKLILSPEDARSEIAKYDEAYTANYNRQCAIKNVQKLKEAPKAYKLDEETGNYIFSYTSKYKPVVKDSQGNLVENTGVSSGSKIQVGYEYNGWLTKDGCGLSMYLKGVRILELVEYTNCDFGEPVEGGYVAEGSSISNDSGSNEDEDF
jgi:hypothetical protein